MFELVVFIIVVAIIYSTASNRFAEFPGEAERANFITVVTQLQSGINLELLFGIVNNRPVSSYEGANPMDLMLEPPNNYIGAYGYIDQTQLPGRIWYFDSNRNELVYLINDNDNVFLIQNGNPVPTTEIRFRLQVEYRDQPGQGGEDQPANAGSPSVQNGGNREVAGLVMRPVVPYRWEGVDLMQIVTEASGRGLAAAPM